MDRTIRSAHRLRGTLSMPGDKSVSHRVLMMASIAEGMTRITNLSSGRDVRSTWGCLSQLGIDIEKEDETVLVHGRGLHGFSPPGNELDVGNSGTTPSVRIRIVKLWRISWKRFGTGPARSWCVK